MIGANSTDKKSKLYRIKSLSLEVFHCKYCGCKNHHSPESTIEQYDYSSLKSFFDEEMYSDQELMELVQGYIGQ